MATAEVSTCVQQIGTTAGVVWQTLSDHGPMTIPQLVKQVEAPRDMVMQAVGWLAREEKVTIEEAGRKRTILLC